MSTYPSYSTPIVVIVPKTADIGDTDTDVTLHYLINNASYDSQTKKFKLTPIPIANADGSLTSAALTVDGSMHIRGKSTHDAQKAQYSVKLAKHSAALKKENFLGMEHGGRHWVFSDTGIFDKSLIRDVMGFHMYRQLGQWAPRSKYFEMFLCPPGFDPSAPGAVSEMLDHYHGVYILLEHIRPQKSRINIPDYSSKTTGVGGLVIQQNPPDEDRYNFDVTALAQTYAHIQLYDPKKGDITPAQWELAKAWFNKFSPTGSTGWAGNFQNIFANVGDSNAHWKEVTQSTDFSSFAAAFLAFELALDQDGYTTSTYYYRTADQPGVPGIMHAGPMWDKNLAFGNTSAVSTTRWQYRYVAAVWWLILLKNKAYCQQVWETWKTNRKAGGILTADVLNAFVDEQANYLEQTGAIGREIGRWHFNADNAAFLAEVNKIKTFVSQRLTWIDAHLESLLAETSNFQVS